MPSTSDLAQLLGLDALTELVPRLWRMSGSGLFHFLYVFQRRKSVPPPFVRLSKTHLYTLGQSDGLEDRRQRLLASPPYTTVGTRPARHDEAVVVETRCEPFSHVCKDGKVISLCNACPSLGSSKREMF